MTQQTAPNSGSKKENSTTTASDPGSSGESATAMKAAITDGARELSTEVKHIAGDVAQEAKKVAESKLGVGKDYAADQLGAVAYALRHTTEQLRAEENPVTDLVAKAATSVDDVSHYIQTRTLSELINDVEGFARREPAMFLGGSFMVGLLGGRFLKSAAPAGRGNRASQQKTRGGDIASQQQPPRGRDFADKQRPELATGSQTQTSGSSGALGSQGSSRSNDTPPAKSDVNAKQDASPAGGAGSGTAAPTTANISASAEAKPTEPAKSQGGRQGGSGPASRGESTKDQTRHDNGSGAR